MENLYRVMCDAGHCDAEQFMVTDVEPEGWLKLSWPDHKIKSTLLYNSKHLCPRCASDALHRVDIDWKVTSE